MTSFRWREALAYRKDNKLLMASSTFILLAFVVYVLFYDILIPGLPGGSYRLAVGYLFLVPSLMLAVGQAFILGFFLHMTAAALAGKRDFLKALFIASFLTFLFSVTYVIFPFYGPFYYIVFAVGGPWYALPVEVLWSAITISAGALLIHRFFNLPVKASHLISSLIVAGIIVTAS